MAILSPQLSVTSYLPNQGPPSLLSHASPLWHEPFSRGNISPGCGGILVAHSSSIFGLFPFLPCLSNIGSPQSSVPHLFSLLSLYFLPLFLQHEEVEIWHAAWESRTRQCVRQSVGSRLEKQALLQAGRPTGLLRLVALLLMPATGLKRGRGARGRLRCGGTRESTSTVVHRREGRNKLNLFWWPRPETGEGCQIPYLQTQDCSVIRRATCEARRLGSSYVVPGLEMQGIGQTEEPLGKRWDYGVLRTQGNVKHWAWGRETLMRWTEKGEKTKEAGK